MIKIVCSDCCVVCMFVCWFVCFVCLLFRFCLFVCLFVCFFFVCLFARFLLCCVCLVDTGKTSEISQPLEGKTRIKILHLLYPMAESNSPVKMMVLCVRQANTKLGQQN